MAVKLLKNFRNRETQVDRRRERMCKITQGEGLKGRGSLEQRAVW
jgi:hypothetical protein